MYDVRFNSFTIYDLRFGSSASGARGDAKAAFQRNVRSLFTHGMFRELTFSLRIAY